MSGEELPAALDESVWRWLGSSPRSAGHAARVLPGRDWTQTGVGAPPCAGRSRSGGHGASRRSLKSASRTSVEIYDSLFVL